MDIENNILKIIELLIENGTDVNSTNSVKVTPVYVAAQKRQPKVVKLLCESGANLSLLTDSKDSVLHAACCSKSDECLNVFFETGKVNNLITAMNIKGKDPFHIAIVFRSAKCCESLLNNGDYLGYKDSNDQTRCTLILENMPNGLELLNRVFDNHVHVNKKSQHDPNFCVEFDYAPIIKEVSGELQFSIFSNLSATQTEKILKLKHPLIESCLFLKWNRLKFLFYSYVLLYFTFLVVHSYFIFCTFGPMQKNWNEDYTKLQAIRIIHIIMYAFILLPGSAMVLWNTRFFKDRQTYYIILSTLASAFVVFSPNILVKDLDKHTLFLERPIAAVSAVVSWGEFTLLLGTFPKIGEYISMLSTVSTSMIKIIIGYSSLLIGFGIGFSIMYNDQNVFSRFMRSMVKILMMMIGEYNYVEMPSSEDKATDKEINLVLYFGSFFLIFFLFVVSILMTNLFLGVAIYDIRELIRYGKIGRLYKEAQYLISYEN
ncbi:unnamed protein product, partial [Meganyctiphanes norvegica]